MEKIALSVAEAAEALGVSKPTVYELIHRDDFPSFKIGARQLISRSGLEAWVQAQALSSSREVN
jgi:excisionase family DNA binding protein